MIGENIMDQSRLRKLRRKRILFRMAGSLLFLITLGLHDSYPFLVFLCAAGWLMLIEFSFWRFKNPNILQVISPDLKELDEYEVTNLNKRRDEHKKQGRIVLYVIMIICLAVAGLFMADALYGYNHGHTFAYKPVHVDSDFFFTTGLVLLFVFRYSISTDRELDRAIHYPTIRQIQAGMSFAEIKEIVNEQQVAMGKVDPKLDEKLDGVRVVNALLFAGALLFLTTLYLVVTTWIRSDGMLPAAFALLPFSFAVSYLVTGGINPFTRFIQTLREGEEWKKEKIGEDWQAYQKWGFVASILSSIILLVYAYLNRGDHLKVDVAHSDPFVASLYYIFAIACGLPSYFLWRRSDRALLPLVLEEEKPVSEVQDNNS